MKLKTLALLVCLAQLAQLVLTFVYAFQGYYFSARIVTQAVLSLPMLAFFFYVWKRQKP